MTLKPGMVISDEPAMYRTGEYGIRTENMILVREDSETGIREIPRIRYADALFSSTRA